MDARASTMGKMISHRTTVVYGVRVHPGTSTCMRKVLKIKHHVPCDELEPRSLPDTLSRTQLVVLGKPLKAGIAQRIKIPFISIHADRSSLIAGWRMET